MTAIGMVAQAVGVKGVVFSTIVLLLILTLLVSTVGAMVKRPRWLGSLEPPPRPRGSAADPNQGEEPPRPISEMTGQELLGWAHGDPEKLRASYADSAREAGGVKGQVPGAGAVAATAASEGAPRGRAFARRWRRRPRPARPEPVRGRGGDRR